VFTVGSLPHCPERPLKASGLGKPNNFINQGQQLIRVYIFIIFAPMTGIIILLGIALVLIVIKSVLSFDLEVPEPFACGTDEVCHCDVSKDCKKEVR